MAESNSHNNTEPLAVVVPPPVIPMRWRLILLVLFALAIAAFYLSGLHHYFTWDGLRAGRDRWRHFVDDHLFWSAVLFLVVSIALMSLSLPVGSILSLTAGALFDLWLGVGLIIVASAFGSMFAFLASRYLLRDFVRRWFGRWLAVVDRGIEKDGAQYLLMLRLSPVVPFFAVNATMGLTSIRANTFFWISQFGMLPSCFLYVLAGTELALLEKPSDILSPELIGILLILAITPLVCRWIFRRHSARKQAREQQHPTVPTVGTASESRL